MANITLSSELEQKITDLQESQKRIEDNLEKAKSNLDETIDNSIIGVMTDDDIIKNEQYKKFFIQTTGNTTIEASRKKNGLNHYQKLIKLLYL